jgi:hypothetical protein
MTWQYYTKPIKAKAIYSTKHSNTFVQQDCLLVSNIVATITIINYYCTPTRYLSDLLIHWRKFYKFFVKRVLVQMVPHFGSAWTRLDFRNLIFLFRAAQFWQTGWCSGAGMIRSKRKSLWLKEKWQASKK